VQDTDRPARLRTGAVAGQRNEINARVEVVLFKPAHQIGQKNKTAAQNADHHQIFRFAAFGNFFNQGVHPLFNLLAGKQYIADVMGSHKSASQSVAQPRQ